MARAAAYRGDSVSSPFRLPQPLLFLACGAFRQHSPLRAVVPACAEPVPAVTPPSLPLRLLPLLLTRKEPVMPLGHLGNPGASPLSRSSPRSQRSSCRVRRHIRQDAGILGAPTRPRADGSFPAPRVEDVLCLGHRPCSSPGSCGPSRFVSGSPLCCEETGQGRGRAPLVAAGRPV